MHTILYVMSVSPRRAVETYCHLALIKAVHVGCS